MAKNRSTQASAKSQDRLPPTFEMAVRLCPNTGIAENVAKAFALTVPDYEAIQSEHERALKTMWLSFDEALNDTATRMHFQRLVGSLIASAVRAGEFYSEKVSDARAASTRGHDGGEEMDGPVGFESKAQRARRFAADICMQAFAVLAAADGAIKAYKEITGEDWKPYTAQNETPLARRSAEAEMGAFG